MNTDDNILLFKREKADLKKKWTNKFLSELELTLEKCFLKNKTKKEHFITREKLEIELIKLLQTQKRFEKTEKKFETSTLAVFDLEESLVGRIKSIDFEKREVHFENICGEQKCKSIKCVGFFDVYSLEMQVFYEKQRSLYDSYHFKDTFSFLTHEKPKEEVKQLARMGILQKNNMKLAYPIDYGK